MFMGEFSHAVDAKGRIIMPARFREELGDCFVLTVGIDGCLTAYPTEAWKSFIEKLMALPSSNKSVRQLQRFFMSNANECEFDKQGRVLLPAKLRNAAKIDKEVTFIGMKDKIEIWDSTKCSDEETFSGVEEASEEMSKLGLSF